MGIYIDRRSQGLLCLAEMSRRLGVCPDTVRGLVQRRLIPAPRHLAAGRSVRCWHESQVAEIAEALKDWLSRPRPGTYRRPQGLLSLGDLSRLLGRPRITLAKWRSKGWWPPATHPCRGSLWYAADQLPGLRRLHEELTQGYRPKEAGCM